MGPALDHYRNFRVFMIDTQKYRISDTLAWHMDPLIMPGANPVELLIAAMNDFTTAVQQVATYVSPPHLAEATILQDQMCTTLQQYQRLFYPQEQRVEPPAPQPEQRVEPPAPQPEQKVAPRQSARIAEYSAAPSQRVIPRRSKRLATSNGLNELLSHANHTQQKVKPSTPFPEPLDRGHSPMRGKRKCDKEKMEAPIKHAPQLSINPETYRRALTKSIGTRQL